MLSEGSYGSRRRMAQ